MCVLLSLLLLFRLFTRIASTVWEYYAETHTRTRRHRCEKSRSCYWYCRHSSCSSNDHCYNLHHSNPFSCCCSLSNSIIIDLVPHSGPLKLCPWEHRCRGRSAAEHLEAVVEEREYWEPAQEYQTRNGRTCRFISIAIICWGGSRVNHYDHQ